MNPTFSVHTWAVPAEQFVEAWNGAGSLDEAVTAIRGMAGGPTPRWALMARAGELRREGLTLRSHTPGTVKTGAGVAGG
jgi:hypothetical protein